MTAPPDDSTYGNNFFSSGFYMDCSNMLGGAVRVTMVGIDGDV